ncbi:hypothetical protein S83_066382, partial [Arachis hypogaea]
SFQILCMKAVESNAFYGHLNYALTKKAFNSQNLVFYFNRFKLKPTPQKSWNHETYLLFPLHLDGTLLDNTKTMQARKESFPTSDVLQIFQQLKELSSVIPDKSTQQLCSGLKHMHGLDTPYAHNDVKPGNVLITHRKGQLPLAILMDFGSARPSRKHIGSRSEALQLQ